MMKKASGKEVVYLSRCDVAERFGVCSITIKRWVREGQFIQPAMIAPGNRWMFALPDVEAFVAAMTKRSMTAVGHRGVGRPLGVKNGAKIARAKRSGT
jgi:uncharacterized protein YjcR